MLVMFRVRNFASFKNEVILDLRAVSYKEMKGHLIDTGKNRVVKSLAVFGKNASGKSNLVSALFFFRNFISNQLFANHNDDVEEKMEFPHISRTPFKLGSSIDNTSEYEIIFYYNGRTYQYGYELYDDAEKNTTQIKSEWLSINDISVYERLESEITSGKKYRKELEKLKKVRDDRLYIATLDYFADGIIKEIVDDFKFYLNSCFYVHFELILETSVKGVISGVSFNDRLLVDKEYKEIVEKFVISADVGITRIEVEKKDNPSRKDKNKYSIKTAHNVFDDSGKVIREELFDLKMESSGTIRYFTFIQYVLDILENGGVFIVDEISARLHPVLTRFIVDLFQSDRNKKAQLVFTTHDLSLMDRRQMRRDEIALVDKNERGESTIYTLADIRTRSDASFSKEYLNGKYGAIPVIDNGILDSEALGDLLWED